MEDTDKITDIEDSQDSHMAVPVPPAPREPQPVRRSRHPFEIAAVAGLTTILMGSGLVVAWMWLTYSDQVDYVSLVVLWLIYVVYSGIVIVPVSIAIAWPLMAIFRGAPNWAWMLMCLGSAFLFAGIAALSFQPQVFLQALTFVLTYAFIFGIAAIWLRSRR